MNEYLFEEVKTFVSEFWHVKKDKFSWDTDLWKLGMAGDDALEFMEAFSEKFNVDMTEFEFDKHFVGEGFNPFVIFSYLYCLIFDRRSLDFIPITLRDLTEAAENKKWPKKEWSQANRCRFG